MFKTERVIDDCRRARAEDRRSGAIHEVVARAVSSPNALVSALGEPREAGIQTLYHAEELTILNITWAPMMTLMPHDHNMWAVISIYSGREDNARSW